MTPVNDPPAANAGAVTTNEDTAATGTLAASDVDGNPLTYSIVANGTKGTAAITNAATGAFTYTPNANANGTDTFTFKANDGTRGFERRDDHRHDHAGQRRPGGQQRRAHDQRGHGGQRHAQREPTSTATR